MTLIELMISVLIATLLIASIFVLVKSFKGTSITVRTEVDVEANVTNFIDAFADEVGSSGNQPADTSLTSIYLAGKVLDFTYSSGSNVSNIKITTDLDLTTRQIVTYSIAALVRAPEHPNEKSIYKTKQLTNNITTTTVYSNQMMLAGVDSFTCVESINVSPVSSNAATRGVECVLTVYGDKTLGNLKTYRIYAKAENQF